MDQELAVRHPGAAKTLLSRKPSRAKEPAIDIGPFLRQEGRAPTRDAQSHSPREDLIKRVRIELGFPSEPARSLHPLPRPARDITAWMGSILQRLRSPG